MLSQVEYFRRRLAKQDKIIKNLEINPKAINITGKKRTYEEAMGYSNDYEVVQNNDLYINEKNNKGDNWVDAYLENLIIKK